MQKLRALPVKTVEQFKIETSDDVEKYVATYL